MLGTFLALLIALFTSTPAQTPTQPEPPPKPAPAEKQAPAEKRAKRTNISLPLQGEKFQIGDVITLLRSVRSGRLKQGRLIEALQSRGIAFPPSELNLARLMNSGAAEPVLEAVEKWGAPQAIPPTIVEPIKPSYTLVVTCEPLECETRIGDQDFRKTAGGKATFTGLFPGRVILDARKTGFETKTEIVALDPTHLSPPGSFQHTITLAPTDATQSLWGATLLASALDKAKITNGHAVISGTLKVTDSGSTEWRFTAHLSESGANSLDLESTRGKVSYISSAGFWQSKSSMRKSPFRGTREEKAKAESALLRNIDAWIAFDYFSVIRGLSKAGAGAKSRRDPASVGEPQELEIHNNRGIQIITLNPQLQISRIAVPSALGTNSPAEIDYSDYGPMVGGIYPARTTLKFADSESHAIAIQVSKFEDDKSTPRAQ